MKISSLLPFAALSLLLTASCTSRQNTGASPAPATQNAKSTIPDRPEKLAFPPLAFEPPNPADYRVALKSGPIAYVVPDHELPLINIAIYVRVGAYVVPVGKEGLGFLTGYLMARGGTKRLTAEQLEERLAFLAAHLNSGVGDTQGSIRLNLLSKDLDEGLTLLRETLTTPRFQEDKLTLGKQQLSLAMKERNDDSANIESREREYLAYGENFWASRDYTAASLDAIHREDLVAFHKQWFSPANFIVAVNGDFDPAAMIAKLETLFRDWPFQGEKSPPIPTNTEFAKPGAYLSQKDVNQGRVSILLPGIQRDDPDYFPGLLMNHILGGGGFTSRIMNRVRSDEGLAYSAGSSFPGGTYYPLAFSAYFQTKSRTVAYAASIVLEEMKKMTAEPATEVELNTAKRAYIDTFPDIFATKSQIANTFAQEEFTGRYARNPEFFKTYRARFQAVTVADVQRVARKFLHPDQVVILAVGQKDEILKGSTDHPVALPALVGGHLTELPQRDPLTLKPVTK